MDCCLLLLAGTEDNRDVPTSKGSAFSLSVALERFGIRLHHRFGNLRPATGLLESDVARSRYGTDDSGWQFGKLHNHGHFSRWLRCRCQPQCVRPAVWSFSRIQPTFNFRGCRIEHHDDRFSKFCPGTYHLDHHRNGRRSQPYDNGDFENQARNVMNYFLRTTRSEPHRA